MRQCDIVMVTWNQLEYTKLCIKSIMDYTDVKTRLIIVDNGSGVDTKEYLNSLGPNRSIELKLIFNNRNLGAIRARNIGMREFDAEHLCLIDNDIEVTSGWLSKMLRLAERNPTIGIINPSSNNFGQFPAADMDINEYARSLEEFKDEYIEVGAGISFCMLIKGEVVRKVGFLDEAMEVMLYEDTDYSLRALKEGYRCIIQRDVYVWHHGHKTSGRLKRYNELARKNRDIFYKRWGRPLRIMWCSKALSESEVMKRVLTNCIELARDGNFVYLFILANKIKNKERLFKGHGLIEHANVHITFYEGRHFKWFCLWRLIKRRKKKYDLALVDDKAIASLMRNFRVFYRAKVLITSDFDEILNGAHNLKFR